MDPNPIPSLSNGLVGSRFVTQDEIDTARKRREEQWKAAYARLGQDPPPTQQQDDHYDGRSLAEKLAANKIAKQEEWEEKNRLANQFRALEEDEIMFLDSVRERQEEEERQRKQRDGEELKSFREAVAARASAASNPPPLLNKPESSNPPKLAPPVKKEVKRPLKGVVVKKKVKSNNSTVAATSNVPHYVELSEPKASGNGPEPPIKRRKM
ncbi:hypothetical protein AMATHDRAFT_52220 [Amanita thiersii Skay4041]|uniref:FAM192A/Fyv6 N-terminal domain-containing protein n=1 Tax=Amanita thiersii Skay4041 TaxID=703135 RepID=A0A2A9P1N5_9AGAR|nr:hypothetical protein AMATHDRAFT_52220 [Amanita thiersii Skay4041]